MISVTKKALNTALARLTRVIPTRSSNPTLTAVHVTVAETGLYLGGTNLEIDLRLHVPAEVSPDLHGQSFTVPAHLWQQGAAKLPAELVSLDYQSGTLHMRSGGSAQKIQTGESEVYPPLGFPEGEALSLPAADLVTALRSVAYAASNESFQAVFRGILLELSPDHVRAVASDGYRVAVCTRPGLPETREARSYIIPRRNAEEIAALLDGEAQAELRTAHGALGITTPAASLNVKLLDGEFPDWQRVVPRAPTLTATLSATALAEALARVSIFADKNANNRVELRFGDGRVEVQAQGDYGDGQETLGAQLGGTESAMGLALNAKHALDALKHVGPGDVVIALSDSTTPVRFTPLSDSGQMAVAVALRGG